MNFYESSNKWKRTKYMMMGWPVKAGEDWESGVLGRPRRQGVKDTWRKLLGERHYIAKVLSWSCAPATAGRNIQGVASNGRQEWDSRRGQGSSDGERIQHRNYRQRHLFRTKVFQEKESRKQQNNCFQFKQLSERLWIAGVSKRLIFVLIISPPFEPWG